MRQNLPPSVREEEEDFPEPPRIRALRRTVTALMVVLGLGVIVIAGTIAWRLAGLKPVATPIVEAESLTLPEGREIVAIGGDGDRLLIATRDADGSENLMVFRKTDGTLIRETMILRE